LNAPDLPSRKASVQHADALGRPRVFPLSAAAVPLLSAPVSVLIVGSTALDSIKTPKAENPRLLGGSASHAAVAASFFAPVKMVGIVGDDFPSKYVRLYQRHGIDLEGLQRAEGQTFHWSGEYELNMNKRRTLNTVLGVFETFTPHLPERHKNTPYVLLANIAPSLQHHVLDQMRRPKFVVADTMDLWLNIALDDLLKLIKRVDAFVLNDSEAHQLTEETNILPALKKIHKLGPKYVIIKKGEHGSVLSGPGGLFIAPAYPIKKVVDPTGAGDSFVGGLLGYLASVGGNVEKNLRRAIIHGSAVASFCCEGFGLSRTTRTKRKEVNARVKELEAMARF
jgi:sugar/nucleoside kinase (ribokinase family)